MSHPFCGFQFFTSTPVIDRSSYKDPHGIERVWESVPRSYVGIAIYRTQKTEYYKKTADLLPVRFGSSPTPPEGFGAGAPGRAGAAGTAPVAWWRRVQNDVGASNLFNLFINACVCVCVISVRERERASEREREREHVT